MTERLGYKAYKCNVCGWVHAAIPLAMAQQSAADLASYRKCFRCGADTAGFVPAKSGDAGGRCSRGLAMTDREGSEESRAVQCTFDLEDLDESRHVLDLSDRRFFVQPNETPADAWWHEEIRQLRVLEAKSMLNAAVLRQRDETEERYKNWLVGICVFGMLPMLAIAAYAIRYLK
jgi:rubredoxin